MNKINTSNFFNSSYKEYAQYTIENRAIPSVVDGLKPGARKILHAALETLNTKTSTKMLNLIGSVYSKSSYAHGDASLESTIINMGARYSDNMSPIEIDGTGGSLRSHANAAPRYLAVLLSKYAKLYEQDKEILEYNMDGDDQIEPKYYLPIIPMSILKRDMGIALGYAYKNAVSYNPVDVIDACVKVINKTKLSALTPHVEEYDGYWELEKDGRLVSKSHCVYEKNKIIVKSLPVSQTFSTFEKNLAKCLERGTIVKWENDSKDEEICYIIHVNESKLSTIIERGLQHRIFKTAEYLPKPTLYLLDENKQILKFKDVNAVIEYFTKFRLSKYEVLRKHKVSFLTERLAEKNMMQRFIDLYLSGKIVINKDVSQEELEKVLTKNKISTSVLSIPIRNLTKNQYDKLTSEITEIKERIEYFTKTNKETLYLNDLSNLRKEIEKDFAHQTFNIL